MLEVNKIRDHKADVVRGLEKRNLHVTADLDEILRLDEVRRKTQAELDNMLS